MDESVPIVLVPGLACSARLYAPQLPALWRLGPVTVADHTRDDSLAAIARRILELSPPRFALAGLSMGGYICMEIMRHAPERVLRLALLDTTAQPETPEQTERRRAQIALAEAGRMAEVIDQLFPTMVHAERRSDPQLRALFDRMADEVGPQAFVRQQRAIMGRPDSRPSLGEISCPTLVLVGEGDELTPPDRASEIASAIPQARLVIIPGGGHLTPLETPEATTSALEAWLGT
jgi:pimeloyl-ACP methyl ester carboxylesterase